VFALAMACTPDEKAPAINSVDSAQAGQLSVSRSGAGYYLAGRHAQNNQDFSNASWLLEKALERSPQDISLMRQTFLTNLADGDILSAAILAQTICEREKSAPIAKLVLVITAIERGDLAGAEVALKTFPDRGFSGFMKPLLQAWTIMGQGRGDEAIVALDPMKKKNGLRVLYELHAALISDVAEKPAAAASHFQSAADIGNRATLRVVQGFGRHYESRGASDKARSLYDDYVRRNPGSVVLSQAMDRLEKGLKPSFLAGNAVEGVSEALFNIASTMTRQSSAQLALIYGRLSIYLRPNFAFAQMLVAGILESMDRYEEAIKVYSDIVPSSPLN
jgi:tetratricopeptide (TPR) repeat protein